MIQHHRVADVHHVAAASTEAVAAHDRHVVSVRRELRSAERGGDAVAAVVHVAAAVLDLAVAVGVPVDGVRADDRTLDARCVGNAHRPAAVRARKQRCDRSIEDGTVLGITVAVFELSGPHISVFFLKMIQFEMFNAFRHWK